MIDYIPYANIFDFKSQSGRNISQSELSMHYTGPYGIGTIFSCYAQIMNDGTQSFKDLWNCNYLLSKSYMFNVTETWIFVDEIVIAGWRLYNDSLS